jgi:exodeoxyribonuclease X
MATHHITQQEVEENGILQSEWPEFIYDDSVDFYVAHNITFDRKFVAIRDDQAICTYKCATWAFEDAESHSNQYLRYYLRLPVVYELCEPPHRALPDAYVTAHILMELLKKFTVDQLIHFTMLPRHIKRFPLGKFYGMELTDPKVDMGYLNWIISKDDMDEDLKHACRNEINRRRGR